MADGPYICHVDDLEWQEVRVQEQDGRRASVWNRFIDMGPDRSIMHTRYDPGMVLARHSHQALEVVYVLEGSLLVGDVACRAGSVIILEAGDSFGPLVTGDEGAMIFEVFTGLPERAGQDREGFDELLAERGITQLPNPPFDRSTPRDRQT
jgi:hypothetical protein